MPIRKLPFRSDVIREKSKINKNIRKNNLKRSNKSYEPINRKRV